MRTNPLPERLHRLFASLAVVVLVSSGAAAETSFDSGTGYLHVISDPRGGYVLVDGRLVGRTPLAPFPMDAGKHRVWVRTSPPEEFEPLPLASVEVTVAAGDTAVFAAELGHLVRITSLPEGAKVTMGNGVIGTTPLRVRWRPRDPGHVELTRAGYRSFRTTLTERSVDGVHAILVADGSEANHVPVVTRDDGIGLNWKAVGFLTAGAASAGLALYLKDRADRAYDDYIDSATPGTMQDRLDEANRYDRYSSAAWLGAEAGIAVGMWFLIKPLLGLDDVTVRSGGGGQAAELGVRWDF